MVGGYTGYDNDVDSGRSEHIYQEPHQCVVVCGNICIDAYNQLGVRRCIRMG